jgi:hypothetical protein
MMFGGGGDSCVRMTVEWVTYVCVQVSVGLYNNQLPLKLGVKNALSCGRILMHRKYEHCKGTFSAEDSLTLLGFGLFDWLSMARL